jgi:hypothetical protein
MIGLFNNFSHYSLEGGTFVSINNTSTTRNLGFEFGLTYESSGSVRSIAPTLRR